MNNPKLDAEPQVMNSTQTSPRVKIFTPVGGLWDGKNKIKQMRASHEKRIKFSPI
jgi:hypothetical protein